MSAGPGRTATIQLARRVAGCHGRQTSRAGAGRRGMKTRARTRPPARIPFLRPVKTLFGKLGKAARLLSEPIYRRGLALGVAASIEHRAIPFGFRHRTVVDVGANRGQFALFAMKRFAHAKLVCLEPLDPPRERLQQVLRAAAHARVLPIAAAGVTEERTMHLSRKDDSSSLLPVGRQATVFPGTEEVGTVVVSAARLDASIEPEDIERPALLKIDVQGAELEVLRGSEGLLDRFDEVLVECSFAELYEGQPLIDEVSVLLRENGFELVAAGTPATDSDRTLVQADVLFRRTTQAASNAEPALARLGPAPQAGPPAR